MELGDIIQKYGTQLKEKITDIYDANRKKIIIGTLGSSLLFTSGCLTTALVGGAVGGLPGAVAGSMLGDAMSSNKNSSINKNKTFYEGVNLVLVDVNGERQAGFKVRKPLKDGSPMYLDVDGDGIQDKVYIDPKPCKRRWNQPRLIGKWKHCKFYDTYVEYGKKNGFEKPEFLALTVLP